MLKGAIGLGSFFLDLAKNIYPDSKEINTAADTAGKVRRAYNVISTTSVHQSARQAYISPIVCIEDSILQAEYMKDLMQIVMLRDVVATLTHLSLQNTVDVGVKVENVIGTINPNRGGMMAFSGLESLNTNVGGLESSNAIKDLVSLAKDDDKGKDKGKDKASNHDVSVNGKGITDLMEYVPLAVGKVVTATLYGEGGRRIDFPLTFRQTPLPMNYADLKTVFEAAKVEEGFFGRWMMVKTKEITPPELLTGRDIVKERFRIRNNDLSGYYKEATKRDAGNKAAAIRTGMVSVNGLANTFIISKDAANRIELEIGKRFTDERSRNDIFKAVKANTIVVCNPDRGLFTFYTHGESMVETYTRNDITVKSKKDVGSNNLEDLLKILNGGY